MPITQAMATSFKVELQTATHNFGTAPVRATAAADTFNIALYTSAASLDASTTVYTTSNEVSSSGTNYTTGGQVLTISQVPTSTGTTAWLDFDDVTWASASFTAAGALIYNATQGNKAVAVLSFGGDKTATAGNFTVQFPTPASSTAILRIA